MRCSDWEEWNREVQCIEHLQLADQLGRCVFSMLKVCWLYEHKAVVKLSTNSKSKDNEHLNCGWVLNTSNIMSSRCLDITSNLMPSEGPSTPSSLAG